MIEKIKNLLIRYREVILYLIFGGLTTVVDWGLSFLLYHFWGEAIKANVLLIHGANVIAWAAAVLFAFITNRIWVFESQKKGFLPVLGELGSFAGGRVMTLLLQEAMFVIFFDILGINEFIVKIVAAVLVIILNYVISKLIVFRKKKEQ
ncbi:MAG: GtrA family protein [Ruminococcaceae bacterium]|nr:GtrA family protein [Oscillospiraceae bacterium]